MSMPARPPPTTCSSQPNGAVHRGWLRPFDELRIGERYESRARTITETDLIKFTALSGDSCECGLGHTLAGHVLALTYSIGLVANSYIGALRRVVDLSFCRQIVVGETIHVECEIERLDEWTEDYGLVGGCWRIVNQDELGLMTVGLEAVWRRLAL